MFCNYISNVVLKIEKRNFSWNRITKSYINFFSPAEHLPSKYNVFPWFFLAEHSFDSFKYWMAVCNLVFLSPNASIQWNIQPNWRRTSDFKLALISGSCNSSSYNSLALCDSPRTSLTWAIWNLISKELNMQVEVSFKAMFKCIKDMSKSPFTFAIMPSLKWASLALSKAGYRYNRSWKAWKKKDVVKN